MQKPTLWILEENISQQMVFSEVLEKDYDLYFFDTLSSLICYQNRCPVAPSALLVNLLATGSQTSSYLQNLKVCPVLCLSPQGMNVQILEHAYSLSEKTLIQPYSKTQVNQAIRELLDEPQGELYQSFHQPLKLVRSPFQQTTLQ